MAIPAFGLGSFRLKDDVVISSVITRLNSLLICKTVKWLPGLNSTASILLPI